MLENCSLLAIFFYWTRINSDYCHKLIRSYTYSDTTSRKTILLLLGLNEYAKIYQHISNLSLIGTWMALTVNFSSTLNMSPARDKINSEIIT